MTRRRRAARALVAGLSLGLLAVVRAASAQGSGSADAEELFKQGRAALEAKDYATACSKLSASLQIERAVGTLISLAECEEASARLAGARQHWQEAADLADATNDRLRRGAFCRQKFADIDKRVPRLTIQLAASAPRDTTFRRDDVALGPAALGSPLPVDPGSHVVTAGAAGCADRTYRVDLGEGEAKTLEIEPGPSSATGAVPTTSTSASATATESTTAAPPPASSSTGGGGGGGGLRTAAYVAGGAGLVGVGVGAVWGIAAFSKWSQAKTDCGNGCSNGSRARSESNDASTSATISTIGFAAGGVLIAAGAVLFFVSRPAQPPPSSARVRFAPVLDARGMGGALQVDW